VTEEVTKALDALVIDLLQQEPHSAQNAVVCIESPRHQFRYAKAVGQARPDSGEAMRLDHAFHWASIGKTLTATLILQLWEEGAFGDGGLDRPLGELAVLPESLLARLQLHGGTVHGHKLSLRQLLNHTSGMKDAMQDGIDLTGAEAGGLAPDSLLGQLFFDETIRKKFPSPMVPWDRSASADARYAGILNFYCYDDQYAKTALFEPGESFHYTDTGYVLLALIVEAVRGKPLHEVLAERIFEPIFLSNIYLAYRSDPVLGVCRQPESEIYFGEAPCLSAGMDLSFDWGGGGIVSAAPTLVQFIKALMAGELFKHSRTLEEMLTWQRPEGLKLPRTGAGLGIFKTEYPAGELLGHSGAWGANMYWDPDSDIYLGGTINQVMGKGNWHWRFFELLKQSLA